MAAAHCSRSPQRQHLAVLLDEHADTRVVDVDAARAVDRLRRFVEIDPTHLITFTLRPDAPDDVSPSAALRALARWHRKRYGVPISYGWTLELHRSGRPHWHALVRAAGPIPHPDTAGWWTYGMTRVDRVRHRIGAARYLAAYLGDIAEARSRYPGRRLWAVSRDIRPRYSRGEYHRLACRTTPAAVVVAAIHRSHLAVDAADDIDDSSDCAVQLREKADKPRGRRFAPPAPDDDPLDLTPARRLVRVLESAIGRQYIAQLTDLIAHFRPRASGPSAAQGASAGPEPSAPASLPSRFDTS